MGDTYIDEETGALGADYFKYDANIELNRRCKIVQKQAILNYRSRK